MDYRGVVTAEVHEQLHDILTEIRRAKTKVIKLT